MPCWQGGLPWLCILLWALWANGNIKDFFRGNPDSGKIRQL